MLQLISAGEEATRVSAARVLGVALKFNPDAAFQSILETEILAEPGNVGADVVHGRCLALGQVLRYVERQKGDWSTIQQAEVDVSLVKQDYILGGKIDLVRGANGTVEIVDFKSEKKPDVAQHASRLEQYRRQLHVYAHLVEQRTGQKVSKMHLYYTGEEKGTPTITFPYTEEAVEGTIASFDRTVEKIMSKDFCSGAADQKTCGNCDFRYYCKGKK